MMIHFSLGPALLALLRPPPLRPANLRRLSRHELLGNGDWSVSLSRDFGYKLLNLYYLYSLTSAPASCLADGVECYSNGQSLGACCEGFSCADTNGSMCMMSTPMCLADGVECYSNGQSLGACCEGFSCGDTDGATCMMSTPMCLAEGSQCYSNGQSLGNCCTGFSCSNTEGATCMTSSKYFK